MTKPAAKCGTDGGYYRHLRITKTKPCDPCKKAHARRKAELEKNPYGKCPCGTQLRTEHEYCSVCRRKLNRAAPPPPVHPRAEGGRLWRQSNYTDHEYDPKRPVAWVRKGLIQFPVYEQSEVA